VDGLDQQPAPAQSHEVRRPHHVPLLEPRPPCVRLFGPLRTRPALFAQDLRRRRGTHPQNVRDRVRVPRRPVAPIQLNDAITQFLGYSHNLSSRGAPTSAGPSPVRASADPPAPGKSLDPGSGGALAFPLLGIDSSRLGLRMAFFLTLGSGTGPHACRWMIRLAVSARSFQCAPSWRSSLFCFSSRTTRSRSRSASLGAFSASIRLGPGSFASSALSPASRTARIHR